MILSGFKFSIIASNPRKNILRHSLEYIVPTEETATTEPGVMPSKQKSKLSTSREDISYSYYQTREDLENAVANYIEFYNSMRPHRKQHNLFPDAFERSFNL